jgi:acetyl-CoA carboxylase biotin carboxyl carrier protein
MARERTERAGDGASLNGAQASLPIAEIRKLISLMDGGDIEELTIEQESAGLKLTLRKPAPAAVGSTALLDDDWDAPEAHEANAEGDTRDESVVEIGAPLVGVFRVSMEPDARALVADGDDVREGQVVGAIEALNVLNEVETQTSGRVRKVLVADGQPVEYGQPLLEIERA